ncbi:MAG TPA: polysaccharide ABC transporter ATP-binding protein [Gemmatimonadaceae bacterium]|nr:polysaccharide ABC transporter ATP-binding protein [Gemmatimonadaceae bacterium]
MPVGKVIFDHVWKKFTKGEFHDSLRDLVPALVKRAFHPPPPREELAGKEFWAVRDVAFEVQPGEALGIIGHNGAGKSTTLKLLTRILKPTRGRCELTGRVGALIEVAAGFHPDLTGRENVYLQGAIMGMKRAEITARYDDIVEFSGLGDFLDTQVKRYSTGMSARLGFAIAAHLEPDVLIIDEVLAVGDMAFQERAFERINAIARSGIPVVVVSHQLERIAALCTHAILLERGSIAHEGSPAECISRYVMTQSTSAAPPDAAHPIRLTSATLSGSQPVRSGERVRIHIMGVAEADVPSAELAIGVRVTALHSGQVVFASGTDRCAAALPGTGSFALDVTLQWNVPPGIYALETHVWDRVRERTAVKGPSLTVTVKGGPTFYGAVQMNPRMEFSQPRAIAIPAGS